MKIKLSKERMWGFLIVVTVFVVCLSSYGRAAQKRVVTIWTDGTEEAQSKIVEENFEKIHPDIDLKFEVIPYSDLATKEMVACKSKTGPDIMWQSYAWTNSFAKMGLLAPYNKWLAKSKAIDLKKDFNAVALELGTVDGKTYGLPWKQEAMGLIYNKQMFREVGLNPDNPPTTWDQVVDYAKKLTKGDQFGYGLVGNAPGNMWFRFVPELWSAGTDVTNKDMTKSLLNSAQAKAAATYYTDLLLKYKVAPQGSINNNSGDVRTLFINKKVAMYIDGLPAVTTIHKDAPDIDIGVGLWPGKNGPAKAPLGGYYLVSPKNAPNLKDAWTFIEYFLSEDVQAMYPAGFPGRVSARQAKRFSDELSQKFAKQLESTRNFLPLADTPKAQEIIMNELQAILTGSKDVNRAMNDAKIEIDATLKPKGK